MNRPTREQQKYLAKLWDKAGPELERIRAQELRGKPYDADEVIALLKLGEGYDGPDPKGAGMVEMQRLFMLHPDHPKNKQASQEGGTGSA